MDFDLNKMVEDIARNDELSKEFSKLDEMDEIYDYCYSMGYGGSEEEFDEGVAGCLSDLFDERNELNDDYLSGIAGGINFAGNFSKTVAVMLSAVALGGVGKFFGDHALNNSKFMNGAASSSFTEKMSGKWSKTKEVISNFSKNNSKAVFGAGVTLGMMIILGALMKKRKLSYGAV